MSGDKQKDPGASRTGDGNRGHSLMWCQDDTPKSHLGVYISAEV
jgi:hypothetical protein